MGVLHSHVCDLCQPAAPYLFHQGGHDHVSSQTNYGHCQPLTIRLILCGGFVEMGSGYLQELSMTYCNFEFNHEALRQSPTFPGDQYIKVSFTCELGSKKANLWNFSLFFWHNGQGESFAEIRLWR